MRYNKLKRATVILVDQRNYTANSGLREKKTKVMQWQLRAIGDTENELNAVLEVYRQCEDFLALGPVVQASMEMVLADLEHSRAQGGVFYGIFDCDSGVMLGIVDYLLAGFEGDMRAADLSLLMIGSPWRGQGLGEAVVRAVEADIRAHGRAWVIHSGVQVNNPGAIKFWTHLGYHIVSEALDMGDGTVAFQLEKEV